MKRIKPRNYGKKDNKDNNGQYINTKSRYISPAHMSFIHSFDENKELNSVVVLNRNAKIKYFNYISGISNNKSPFHQLKNKDPLTFYCGPGSKVAINILSKFKDKEKYPEFYNATIVFIGPKFVGCYQKNLDDVDNYQKMNGFIERYEENEDYFPFKLSECSRKRIDQLYDAQTNFSDTWGTFVKFMEMIGVKKEIEVKDVETKN